jgi:DNA-directed RNA polymerase subunit F
VNAEQLVGTIRDPLLPDQQFIDRYRTLPNLPSLVEIAKSQENHLTNFKWHNGSINEAVKQLYEGSVEIDNEDLEELFDKISDDEKVEDKLLRRGVILGPQSREELKILLSKVSNKVWIPQSDWK